MRVIFIVVAVFSGYYLFAQEDEIPPCDLKNDNIRSGIKAGEIQSLRCCGANYSYGAWATSTLGPSKPFPSFESKYGKSVPEDERSMLESQYSSEEATWDCQYSAFNLSDSKTTTAWVEGTSGPGIGEIVLTQISDPSKPIKIWNGYGKSAALYNANNRVNKFRAYLLRSYCRAVAVTEGQIKGLKVVGSIEGSLKDINGYQTITFPKLKPIPKGKDEADEFLCSEVTYFIAIEILSVYKGTKFDDTCISEISN